MEKKKLLQERIAQWTAQLARFECPPEIAQLRDELLYAPDRNKPEAKALEQACARIHRACAKAYLPCGIFTPGPDMAVLRNNHGYRMVVVGNDIDTDRIIPARFMKCVTFDGLGDADAASA